MVDAPIKIQNPKDPDEVLDYQLDWTLRLDGDTISSSDWTIAADDPTSGIVINSETNTTTHAKVWVSGGTIGKTAKITNRIVTAGGRTYDQSLLIKIKGK